MSTDIETFHDIKTLVDRFYAAIRNDEMLGPIFTEKAQVDWVEHIPRLCDFWETVLFASAGYKGDPIDAHIELHRQLNDESDIKLGPVHFEHWLNLFSQTVDGLFEGPVAEKAKRSADRMATRLLTAIKKAS